MTALEVVFELWRLMGTDDFHAVGAVLSDDGGPGHCGRVGFWPETTVAPANRSHWVELIRSSD